MFPEFRSEQDLESELNLTAGTHHGELAGSCVRCSGSTENLSLCRGGVTEVGVVDDIEELCL
jgi:hypothetical protein